MKRKVASMPEKNRLRRRLLRRREQLTLREAGEGSAALCAQLEGPPELAKGFAEAGRIAAYIALGKEVDIFSFVENRLKEGVEVFLPRVLSHGRLEFAALTSFESLEIGPFGIAEPQGPAIDPTLIEFFLVPGIGFDRRGNRLGFGKGYYDRSLPEEGTTRTIGVGYHWQLVETILPVESHDRPMDLLVTDQGWIIPGEGDEITSRSLNGI